MKAFCQSILTVLLILLFFISNAQAELKSGAAHFFLANNQQGSISEQEAVDIAQTQISGRILTIIRAKNTFRIKILTDQSTVHTVTINAFDGKIVSAH